MNLGIWFFVLAYLIIGFMVSALIGQPYKECLNGKIMPRWKYVLVVVVVSAVWPLSLILKITDD